LAGAGSALALGATSTWAWNQSRALATDARAVNSPDQGEIYETLVQQASQSADRGQSYAVLAAGAGTFTLGYQLVARGRNNRRVRSLTRRLQTALSEPVALDTFFVEPTDGDSAPVGGAVAEPLPELDAVASAAPELEGTLLGIRTAIQAEEFRDAQKALDLVERAAPDSEQVLPASALARIWFYRGVIAYQSQTRDGPLPDWRQSIVLDPELEWDSEVLPRGDPQSLYEALKSEVRGREQVDVGVPEATGLAMMYVDGNRVRHGDTVVWGMHLAQIRCPDGQVLGTWTHFERPLKWFKMCPGGVDPSQTPAPEESQDEWEGMDTWAE
jgi:hypothetical protein